jgi:arylsulfatase A-like enzyme
MNAQGIVWVATRSVACLALAAIFGAPPPASGAESPRGVLLVTIDTLRADHLGAYGYERPTSPFLDSLAKRGTLFEHAFASAPMTAPSHASLFTGLYPPQHGVRINEQGFAPSTGRHFRTLAEMLVAAGYKTAAFTGVGFLRSISQGFLTVDAGSGDYRRYRQADATVTKALAWLALRKPGERYFVWLHLFDVHPPRRPPPEGAPSLVFSSRAAALSFARAEIARHGVTEDVYPNLAALAREYAAYDSEIAFADAQLRRLFDGMNASGHGDCLWIVTADHGEGLGDHGWRDHVRYVYDEAVHVPLIVYQRGRFGGLRVKDLVRHVDVAPTLLELLGLPFEQPGFTPPGRSVLPLLEGRAMTPAVAFYVRPPWREEHKTWEKGEVFGMQDLRYKYIAHTAGRDELFDLRSDPLELRNLAGDSSVLGDRLESLTLRTFAELRSEGAGVVASRPTAETTEELRALGYVH